MEVTYENLKEWFDAYFEDVNKNQGPIEVVSNLRKYFTEDFEFWMYTAPSFVKVPLSREGLLLLLVHPNLHEKFTLQYYVIDVKQMMVVVQFEVRFTDQTSGQTWPPKQASAHYHLVLDEKKGLMIKKIQYWTQSHAPEVMASLYKLWNEYREKALADLATNYLAAK
jgi:hypothetical protein